MSLFILKLFLTLRYRRILMARTLMARLPCPAGTCSWIVVSRSVVGLLVLGLLLFCSHSPNNVPPRTSAERIHSRGTGCRASVQILVLGSLELTLYSYDSQEHILSFNPLYMVDSSTVVCLTSPFVILGVSGLLCRFYSILMENPVSKQCSIMWRLIWICTVCV